MKLHIDFPDKVYGQILNLSEAKHMPAGEIILASILQYIDMQPNMKAAPKRPVDELVDGGSYLIMKSQRSVIGYWQSRGRAENRQDARIRSGYLDRPRIDEDSSKAFILAVLSAYPGSTRDDIIRTPGSEKWTMNRLSSQLSDMKKAGLVTETSDEKRASSGKMQKMWKIC